MKATSITAYYNREPELEVEVGEDVDAIQARKMLEGFGFKFISRRNVFKLIPENGNKLEKAIIAVRAALDYICTGVIDFSFSV